MEHTQVEGGFLASVIVPIEKKQGAQQRLRYRAISLISHASKTVLKTLRHGNKAEEFLS